MAAPEQVTPAKSREHAVIVCATVVLWIIALALVLLGVGGMLGMFDHSGMDAAGRGLAQALGFLLLVIGAAASIALWLARRWRVWLIIAGLMIAAPTAFFGWYATSLAMSEARHREYLEELHSGRHHFGDQPALLAVAQAIDKNDADAIRAAAKAVPDLNAAGREGMTLLNFAVERTWQRPELVPAVATLLASGADPNFTTGEGDSYAMANSVHGPVALLRTMLDGGGNPNAVDEQSRPMIFGVWQLGYFESERRARLELLLERGADINSALPDSEAFQGGYTLLLYRAGLGRGDATGYADALLLLERGADPNRAAKDGMTLAQLMQEHRAFFTPERGAAPPEFEHLWQALVERGVLPRE
jgi:hypothetical protein